MASRLLVVDDDLAILEVYRSLLEAEGYEVFLAERAYEQVSDIEYLHPDLIILDLKMRTEQAGWQFLQALLTSPFTASLPLILCTAAFLSSEQEHYLQQQKVSLIYKPFDVDEFLRLVCSRLETTLSG